MSELDRFTELAAESLRAWPDGLDACAAALGALAASDALAERVARALADLAATPTHMPAARISRHAWVLWTHPSGARLTVLRVAAGDGDDAGFLTDSASHQVIAACGPLPVEGDRYTQDAAPDPEVMSPAYALTRREAVTLRRGEAITLRPRRDVFDIAPRGEDRHALVFDGPRALTQQWVYARSSLAPVSSVAADPHDARLESAMRLLRVLEHTPAAPVVAALAAHDAHFVRWTAIRYTLALDPAAGRALLAAAADDPHPHVRDAARRAMARLDAAPP